MFSELFKRSKSNDPAFKKGKLAFSNGIDISQNPYQNSAKHFAISWENGWKEAQKARKVLEKKHKWPQSPARPTDDNQPSYAGLDSHVQRFIEIGEALGEIGTIFESIGTKTESESSDSDPLEQIAQNVNKLRVPGYFAYHLAQEALSLLNVIAASAALAKKDIEASERLKAALSKIKESEPTLRRTVYEMEPYKSMDANEAIQVIASRITEKKEI